MIRQSQIELDLLGLRCVCPTNPKSRAIGRIPGPSLMRLPASSLNSVVYSCFGILNINSFQFRYPIRLGLGDEIRGKRKPPGI